MDTLPNTPPTAANPSEQPKTPDLVGLADQLAAKHGAGTAAPGADPPGGIRNKGGRRTVAEEARDYLAKNGLKAVPLDSEAPATAVPESGAPDYVVDPAFVKHCVQAVLEGCQAYRQRSAYDLTLRIEDNRDMAKEMAGQAAAPPGCIEVMAMCSAEIAQKLDLMSSYSPEVLFFVAAGAWIQSDVSLHRKLNALLEAKGVKS